MGKLKVHFYLWRSFFQTNLSLLNCLQWLILAILVTISFKTAATPLSLRSLLRHRFIFPDCFPPTGFFLASLRYPSFVMILILFRQLANHIFSYMPLASLNES
jgi:hypothetical protein